MAADVTAVGVTSPVGRWVDRLDDRLPRGSARRSWAYVGVMVAVTLAVANVVRALDHGLQAVAGATLVYLVVDVAFGLGAYLERRRAVTVAVRFGTEALDVPAAADLAVEGGYLLVHVEGDCTCDPGPEGQHQRLCGWEPLVRVDDLRSLGFSLRRH